MLMCMPSRRPAFFPLVRGWGLGRDETKPPIYLIASMRLLTRSLAYRHTEVNLVAAEVAHTSMSIPPIRQHSLRDGSKCDIPTLPIG